jgi:CRISPR-associated protein Cas1
MCIQGIVLGVAMRDYYVVKSGRLRRHENTLQLEFANGEKKSLPINDIRSIHLFGEIDLNTKLIVFLNQHGIPVHFYNYYGYYSGSFYPREKLLSGFLLVKQVQHYLDNGNRLEIAREIVRTAIHNILANLAHYKKGGKDVDTFMEKIKAEAESVDSCGDVQQLMGVEGRSRDHYYSSFDTILREGFRFEKRTKMPPQNMLNSLISFGNSLLYSTTLTEIYHTQLSPTISYLHEPGERRYSLALDVSEIFKPIIVDRVIFNLVNNRVIKPEHFLEELNACYLNEGGRRTFIAEYQKKLETTIKHSRLKRHVSYQRLIRIECFKLVKHILGDRKYAGLKSR